MSTDATPPTSSSPSSANSPSLPDDLVLLKQMIEQLLGTLHERDREVEQLQHRLNDLLRRLYGPRAERYNPNQQVLFDLEEGQAPPDPSAEELPAAKEATSRRKARPHGRRKLPDNLRREIRIHELAEAERLCPCCGKLRVSIGEDVSEQLDYHPASLFVIEHQRVKYACAACEEHVVIAAKPPQPIDKGLPGPGLLAQVVVSKYFDHCVQGKAVDEMRVGLSWSGCRTRPQTAGMLLWSRAMVVSDSGKGAARPRQVGAGKTNESEPRMKCRKSMLMSKPGSGDCSGTSVGATCLLPTRHPALMRRESGTGSFTEPWNLSSR